MNTKTTDATQQAINLPESPSGFHRELVVHTIFEDGNSTGVYTITDPKGQPAPFGYRFDTRKGGVTGFTVPGVEGAMTWERLRRHYAVVDHQVEHLPSDEAQAGAD